MKYKNLNGDDILKKDDEYLSTLFNQTRWYSLTEESSKPFINKTVKYAQGSNYFSTHDRSTRQFRRLIKKRNIG